MAKKKESKATKKVVKKVAKKKEVAVVNNPAPENNVDTLIAQAVDKGASVEVMERLFALHEKVQASKAKSEFNRAMGELQAELPVIKKLKKGHVAAFAPLEDIVELTKQMIQKHGFTYRWNTEEHDNRIKVTCIATHVLGHSESVDMSSEVEETVTGKDSGKATKSAPQRAASTITFLRRYTFVHMFGITVAGEDFDGRMEKQRGGSGKEKTPAKTLEERAIEKIETSNEVGVIIKVDEYVQGDKNFSKEFKAKIKKMANEKVTRLENE